MNSACMNRIVGEEGNCMAQSQAKTEETQPTACRFSNKAFKYPLHKRNTGIKDGVTKYALNVGCCCLYQVWKTNIERGQGVSTFIGRNVELWLQSHPEWEPRTLILTAHQSSPAAKHPSSLLSCKGRKIKCVPYRFG